MITMNFDFAYTEIDAFHRFVDGLIAVGHPIQIDRFIEVGPGGGNPNVTLSVDARVTAVAIVDFYYRGVTRVPPAPRPGIGDGTSAD